MDNMCCCDSDLFFLTNILIIYGSIALIASIAYVIGFWKVFVKAGYKGWKSIIPIYNLYIMVKIAERPTWYTWLFLTSIVPIVGSIVCFAVYLILTLDIAKRFSKPVEFAIGMALLPFIFYVILGFDNSKYTPLSEPQHIKNEFEDFL